MRLTISMPYIGYAAISRAMAMAISSIFSAGTHSSTTSSSRAALPGISRPVLASKRATWAPGAFLQQPARSGVGASTHPRKDSQNRASSAAITTSADKARLMLASKSDTVDGRDEQLAEPVGRAPAFVNAIHEFVRSAGALGDLDAEADQIAAD